MRYRIHYPAKNYLLLDFKQIIDEKINNYLLSLSEAIIHEAVIEKIPAYSSLLIEFNDKLISGKKLSKYIKDLKPLVQERKGVIHNVPVYYGGDYGPDLAHVAKINNLTESEVVKIHSSVKYRVYMLGFMPGFCYLGGMDRRISCNRLENPRIKIVKGSVGIAGNQTGIYPQVSPGGWQIIGRTDFELFNINLKDPFPIKAGDYIKFQHVNIGDYSENT